MKMIKNTLKYLSFALMLIIGLFVVKNELFVSKMESLRTPQIDKINTGMSAGEHFENQLATELDTVWQSCEKIGITKQRYESAKEQNRERYLRSDFPGGTTQISTETTQFVHGIMQEHGVDPAKVTLVGFNDISPAAATEKVIYINEPEFNNYSQAARRFVIGHELQHILHKDNSSRYTLELMCNGAKAEEMGDNKDHPLCQYNRLKEKRADVKTATRSLDWAESYLAFAQEWYKRAGEHPGITHPKNVDRIALAKDIVPYMKHNPQQVIA